MAVGDYKRDPSIRATDPETNRTLGGPPPQGHVKQCQAKARSTGKQCRGWALRGGYDYCKLHAHYQRGNLRDHSRRKRVEVNRYAVGKRDNLKALLKKFAQGDNDQLALNEEIDLARVAADRAARIFEAICLDTEITEEDDEETIVKKKKVSTESKKQAIRVLQEALTYVSNLVMTQQKLEMLKPDTFTMNQMDHFITEIIGILTEELEDQKPVLERIIDSIEQIRPTPKDERSINISFS